MKAGNGVRTEDGPGAAKMSDFHKFLTVTPVIVSIRFSE